MSADTPDTPENLFPAMPEQEWFELVDALEREIAVAWLDDSDPTACPPPARAAIEALRLLERRGYLSPPPFHPADERRRGPGVNREEREAREGWSRRERERERFEWREPEPFNDPKAYLVADGERNHGPYFLRDHLIEHFDLNPDGNVLRELPQYEAELGVIVLASDLVAVFARHGLDLGPSIIESSN